MSKFLKAILIVISILLLVGLAMVLSVFLPIPWLSNYTSNMVASYPWITTALAVVVLFFIISTFVGILVDFFLPSRKKAYELPHQMGEIEISNKSIESVANLAMAEVPGVRRYKANVKGSADPRKLKLNLYAETDPNIPFAPAGKEIQDHVTDALQKNLDIKPNHVHLKIEPLGEDKGTMGAKDIPRVM